MIDDIIKNKIKMIEYRKKQIFSCKKNVKSYYLEDIRRINYEIVDLRALNTYNQHLNDSNIIDLHGANRHFIEKYLNDLLFYKMNFHRKVEIITGKGGKLLFNSVKKLLDNESLSYEVKNFTYFVNLD